MINDLEFYAIRNKEGKYFRAKGYCGGGENWVSDLKKARIYQKLGPARSIVSFYHNNYPEYGTPDLVKFTVSETEIIDESIRIKKQEEKQQKRLEKVEQKKQEILELNEVDELDRLKRKYEGRG